MTSTDRLDLRGLHAIVTGGASGIGLIISSMLLEHGTSVTILDINPTTASSSIQSLQSAHPSSQISFQQCNVSDYASQLTAFQESFAKYGRIDIVVPNAGISAEHQPGQNFVKSPSTLSPDAPPPLNTLDVNLTGLLYTVHIGMFFIRKGGRGGSIMCTASNAGIYPFQLAPIYATAKHGVVGLVRSIAPVLKNEGITINAIAPSIIRTNIGGNVASNPLFDAMIETPPMVLAQAVHELITNRSLTGKIAELGPEGENGCSFAEPPEPCNESTRHNFEVFLKLGKA